ncbi:PRC-barrel domain-containing protein [Acetobacter sp. DsW_063]|uniref:PRC-barrel domain-containing protein n=1 Tax=Acetobacter sp. DsW_063 TaxID=1514894 RepID=UPI001302E393|nr:PRC-barrel domain-containing protein [Acetobacter sp. DsW_063]
MKYDAGRMPDTLTAVARAALLGSALGFAQLVACGAARADERPTSQTPSSGTGASTETTTPSATAHVASSGSTSPAPESPATATPAPAPLPAAPSTAAVSPAPGASSAVAAQPARDIATGDDPEQHRDIPPQPTLAVSNGGAGSQAPAVELAQLRLGRLIDRELRGADHSQLGRIVDVLVGTDGKVAAVVADIGGFMGVGNRRVAIAWSLLALDHADPKGAVVAMASSSAVRSAPEFNPDAEQVQVVNGPRVAPAQDSTSAPDGHDGDAKKAAEHQGPVVDVSLAPVASAPAGSTPATGASAPPTATSVVQPEQPSAGTPATSSSGDASGSGGPSPSEGARDNATRRGGSPHANAK